MITTNNGFNSQDDIMQVENLDALISFPDHCFGNFATHKTKMEKIGENEVIEK